MRGFFLTSIFLLLCINSFSQRKGKEYFLIDSLVYDSLTQVDRQALDSLLALYHKAKGDTARLGVLDELATSIVNEKIWIQSYIVIVDVK